MILLSQTRYGYGLTPHTVILMKLMIPVVYYLHWDKLAQPKVVCFTATDFIKKQKTKILKT